MTMKRSSMGNPAVLSASAAVALIADGNLSAAALLDACVERIDAREPTVGAWAHLDLAGARAAARKADRTAPLGPLHGIPIGVKDVVDTAGMPTTYGSPIYASHVPATDAACIRRLRQAGAIVLGKTVSTEFAAYHPGRTTHPFNPLHTPGGSSSGSAAAVADCHVGIALGTQTSGSIIRPASFNGVIGYKPTVGTFDYGGIKALAPSLDTLGLFVREFADLSLMREALGAGALACRVARAPRIGLCRTDRWLSAEPAMRDAVERTARALAAAGAVVDDAVLPQQFDTLQAAHQVVMSREASRGFARELSRHEAQLSSEFRQLLLEGASYTDEDEWSAWREVRACRDYFAMVMRDFDVLLTVAATGEAPRGLGYTGNPMFNRVWTLLGVPCVTYPVGRGGLGLPLGVQVIGPAAGDDLLIACAAWMYGHTGLPIALPDMARAPC
jgi:Asp-tRNA(Asn)/Glu-tRNA(Gln) amidotransferase A subunit family amidase